MQCESCRIRPGILWQPVRSAEGWSVTRVLCPYCARVFTYNTCGICNACHVKALCEDRRHAGVMAK